MSGNGNGIWQKLAMGSLTVLMAITLGWTASQSRGADKCNKRHSVAEENIRTIHYEAQVQRQLLESIAKAVGAETGLVPDVRPLREVD